MRAVAARIIIRCFIQHCVCSLIRQIVAVCSKDAIVTIVKVTCISSAALCLRAGICTGIKADQLLISPGIVLNLNAVVREGILEVSMLFIVLVSNSALTERSVTIDRHLQEQAVEAVRLRNINRNRNGHAALFNLDLILTTGLERNNCIIDLTVCCSVCTESQSAAHSRRCQNKRRKSRDEFLHDNLILSGLTP